MSSLLSAGDASVGRRRRYDSEEIKDSEKWPQIARLGHLSSCGSLSSPVLEWLRCTVTPKVCRMRPKPVNQTSVQPDQITLSKPLWYIKYIPNGQVEYSDRI